MLVGICFLAPAPQSWALPIDNECPTRQRRIRTVLFTPLTQGGETLSLHSTLHRLGSSVSVFVLLDGEAAG